MGLFRDDFHLITQGVRGKGKPETFSKCLRVFSEHPCKAQCEGLFTTVSSQREVSLRRALLSTEFISH